MIKQTKEYRHLAKAISAVNAHAKAQPISKISSFWQSQTCGHVEENGDEIVFFVPSRTGRTTWEAKEIGRIAKA